MNAPEDYGLSPIKTLATVADVTPAPMHTVFWTAWQQAVFSGSEPALIERHGGRSDPSDPTATHEFLSLRSVRIGAALFMPPKGTPTRAGLVALHGYERPPVLAGEGERWEHLRRRGVAVLCVRVRGFAGSMADVPQMVGWPLGWITFGLDAPMARASDLAAAGMAWSLPQGVADVVNACRALSRHIGHEKPMFLHGESFGGGLAVLAAAACEHATERPMLIERMAIGLPTLGDWPWRLARKCRGALPGVSAEVEAFLTMHAARREHMVQMLRLADAVVHAPKARAATLCKLAERDDVVPAPTAAAVFNALAADPGRKWRFVTPFGHYDGGLRNARRHAMFDLAVDSFLDPTMSLPDSMCPWEPVLWSGERAPEGISRAAVKRDEPEAGLFDTHQRTQSNANGPAAVATGIAREAGVLAEGLDARIASGYARAGRTLDDLPYTPEFDGLFRELVGPGVTITPRELFHRMHNLRKAGKLPKVGRASTPALKVTPGDEDVLRAMVVEAVGSLGQRDQLPMTPAFDGLVERFNGATGRSLTPHDVWRLVAKLAK